MWYHVLITLTVKSLFMQRQGQTDRILIYHQQCCTMIDVEIACLKQDCPDGSQSWKKYSLKMVHRKLIFPILTPLRHQCSAHSVTTRCSSYYIKWCWCHFHIICLIFIEYCLIKWHPDVTYVTNYSLIEAVTNTDVELYSRLMGL